MAPEIPITATLRIRRCFSDALSVWANNILVLFGASVIALGLSALTATLLMGSLYAGLLLMTLRGLQGQPVRFCDLFGQVRRFLRFFSITVFIMLFFILGLLLIPVPLFLQSDLFASLLSAFRQHIIDDTPWMIAIGPEDIVAFLNARKVILLTVALTFFLLFVPFSCGLFCIQMAWLRHKMQAAIYLMMTVSWICWDAPGRM